ncbi:MAG: hypothetical protein HPY79_05445 [Bacteroidales bacterium]|nr:hypothetical protein [Bacteroidales bacterium]
MNKKFNSIIKVFLLALFTFNFQLLPINSSAKPLNNLNETPTGFTQSDRERLIRIETILEQHDKRFESIDKRFESIDKRFEESRSDMNTHFGWLIALFTAITISTISFALWDRRTMIRPFETKVNEIKKILDDLQEEKTANKILNALRELAKKDNQLAEILKSHNLL